MQLEEELNGLKDPNSSTEKADGEGDDAKKNNESSTTASSTTSGSTTEYTVQDGDTAWKIAQKFLGNGAEYQKILDANGLKESDTLKPGSKIKIPK